MVDQPATRGFELGGGPSRSEPDRSGLDSPAPSRDVQLLGETGRAAARAMPRRRRRGWRSPLTRRILAVNVLALLIPVLGLLHLDQYRESLVTSELESLKIQGRAFALSLGTSAAASGESAEERLVPETTRQLMRLQLSDSLVRARVFSLDGNMIADSFLLMDPGGQVQVIELPEPDDGSLLGVLHRLYQAAANWIPGAGDLPLYSETAGQTAADYGEVGRALGGESEGRVRVDRNGRLVLTMAVPVQRYRKVLGALMLSKEGGEIDALVRDRRGDILMVFGSALAITVLLSLYLAGTLARPIRRLADAADLVRQGKGRRFEIPDFTGRGDEIGDLSGALREMTADLRNRLHAIEGFAADVAHEIKNPLTSLRSAVETVARIEDPEQQKKLMSIILDDVQRLDRLISDISDASRLDAELSRSETESVEVGKLLEALVEVHRATVGENGPRFEFDVPAGAALRVAGLEGQIGQVFRNLLSNAISFSPKDGVIRLSARREDGWVAIAVSDDGPGLPGDKLEAVFDRFYSERPKDEKFGTHSGLGLSISRQIVEAHGGIITAENRRHADGRVAGARFVVRLPAE